MKANVRTAAAIAAACAALHAPATAIAQTSSDDMKQKIDLLQQQIDALRQQLDQVSRQQASQAAAPALPAPTSASSPAVAGSFIERKSGDGMTFLTRGGEISIYANLDISLDTATKGIGAKTADGEPTTPVGRAGWMPDISTNVSYVGVRGFQSLGGFPANFVYQLETQVDVSAASGTSASNSNSSDVVKGGLTSRNSYIGLANSEWGAVKIGKTDAPYKISTNAMNPFAGMWGDYSVIMANTGGDNRVEFGTRLDHAIWYESPNLGGFNLNLLFAPGQNRANDSSNLAAGEVDCAGGNVPGSGGLPVACNDGAYSNAYSASATYRAGGLYAIGAYEFHSAVNRTSDLATFDPTDVASHIAGLAATCRV